MCRKWGVYGRTQPAVRTCPLLSTASTWWCFRRRGSPGPRCRRDPRVYGPERVWRRHAQWPRYALRNRLAVPARRLFWTASSPPPPLTTLRPLFRSRALPASSLQKLRFLQLRNIDAMHPDAQIFTRLQQLFRVVEISRGFHDGTGAHFRIVRLEDA